MNSPVNVERLLLGLMEEDEIRGVMPLLSTVPMKTREKIFRQIRNAFRMLHNMEVSGEAPDLSNELEAIRCVGNPDTCDELCRGWQGMLHSFGDSFCAPLTNFVREKARELVGVN